MSVTKRLLVAWVIYAAVSGVALVALTSPPVSPHARGAEAGVRVADPATSAWLKSVKRPDAPTSSCCGDADKYWADEFKVENGKTFVTITDDEADTIALPDGTTITRKHIPPGTVIEVPNEKLTWRYGNPTGRGIIFVSTYDQVLCYIPPGGV